MPAAASAARLAHDGLGRAAALRAAQLGDDAEGAGAIAALGDLDVGGVRRHRGAARRDVVVEEARRLGDADARGRAADRVGDGADLVGAEEVVDLGHLVGQLARVALREAARDDQALAAAGLLVARHLEDRVDRLLLGLADEAAGVDDDDLGVLGRGDDLVARPVVCPSMTSVSTRFLGQPSETKWTFMVGSDRGKRGRLARDTTRVGDRERQRSGGAVPGRGRSPARGGACDGASGGPPDGAGGASSSSDDADSLRPGTTGSACTAQAQPSDPDLRPLKGPKKTPGGETSRDPARIPGQFPRRPDHE